MSAFYPGLRLRVCAHRAHRQVARARHYFDSFRDLLVVGGNENALSHDSPIGRHRDIETQLGSDERAIVIELGRRRLQ